MHVRKTCLEACKHSYAQFLEKNNIKTNLDDNAKDDDHTGHIMGDTTHRKMEFTQLAAMRTHFKTLVRFIKMVDLVQTRSNLQLAIDVMKKLCDSLTFTEEKWRLQQEREKKNKIQNNRFVK